MGFTTTKTLISLLFPAALFIKKQLLYGEADKSAKRPPEFGTAQFTGSPTNLLDFAIQITKSPETSRLSNSKEW